MSGKMITRLYKIPSSYSSGDTHYDIIIMIPQFLDESPAGIMYVPRNLRQ